METYGGGVLIVKGLSRGKGAPDGAKGHSERELDCTAESASKFGLVSLTCNKCSVGLLGVCMNTADEVCITNTSSCFTGRATFPSLATFIGFNTRGCLESAMCNTTTNANLLGATYTSVKTCCNSNKCNPVTTSAKLSVTTAIGAALVASMWSMLY